MHRLTAWLWLLDSYAGFNIHRRILTEVIASKQRLHLDDTGEQFDTRFIDHWFVVFVFDERKMGHNLKLRQTSGGAFCVGPLFRPGGTWPTVEFRTLHAAFDCFFGYIRRHVPEPYRLCWHPFNGNGMVEEQIGPTPDDRDEVDLDFWDNSHGMRSCWIYDWSDDRQFYYDERRCANG